MTLSGKPVLVLHIASKIYITINKLKKIR